MKCISIYIHDSLYYPVAYIHFQRYNFCQIDHVCYFPENDCFCIHVQLPGMDFMNARTVLPHLFFLQIETIWQRQFWQLANTLYQECNCLKSSMFFCLEGIRDPSDFISFPERQYFTNHTQTAFASMTTCKISLSRANRLYCMG